MKYGGGAVGDFRRSSTVPTESKHSTVAYLGASICSTGLVCEHDYRVRGAFRALLSGACHPDSAA